MDFHNGMEMGAKTKQTSGQETFPTKEALYHLITDNVSDLIWITDMNFRFTYLSPSATDLGGYSVEEAMELTWSEILSPDSLQVALTTFQEAFHLNQTGQASTLPRVRELELEQRHKDGHYVWTEVRASFLRDDDGGIAGIIGITRDITERKEAMGELTHNQRLLLALSKGAKAIQHSKSPEAIFKAIGEETRKLDLETTVFKLNDDQAILSTVYLSLQSKVVQAAEKLTGLSANGYSFSVEPGNFFDQIISSKEAVYSLHDTAPFTSALPRVLRKLAKQLFALLNFNQSIIAPMIVNDKVYGLLSISGEKLKVSDLPAVTTFASQAAVAIENSLLLMRVIADSNELERRVNKRTKELNDMLSIMSGREIRMAGLKKAINVLRTQLLDAGLTPAADDPLLEDKAK